MWNKKESRLIKLETALLLSFIAVLVGFLGGVVFSAYKMGTTSGPMDNVMSPMSPKEPGISHEVKHAIEALEAKLETNPDDVAEWIELGHLYFDHQMTDKAIEAYNSALALQPGNVDVLTDLGVMYRRAGKPGDALAAFEKAQNVSPGHEASLFNIGVVKMHDLNDPEGALVAWGKLVQLNPSAKTPSGQLVQELINRLKQHK